MKVEKGSSVGGTLTPAQSVQQMLTTIGTLGLKDSGKFVNTDGSPLPF